MPSLNPLSNAAAPPMPQTGNGSGPSDNGQVATNGTHSEAQLYEAHGEVVGEVARAPGAEQRWRAVVENSSDFITEVDEHGLFRFVSPNHKRLLGRDPSEMIGQPALDFLHPEDVGRMLAVLARLSEPGQQEAVEMRIRQADGSWLWSASTMRLGKDEDGSPFWLCLSRDITERKQLEDERALLSRLSEILNREDDLRSVARALSAILKPLLPFDLLFISLVGADGMELAASDLEPNDETPIYFDATRDGFLRIWPLIQALGESEVIWDNDFPPCTAEQWALTTGNPIEEWRHWPRSNFNTRAFVNVPLLAEGEPVGLLHFDSFEPNVFAPEHLSLACLVAAHIAGALRRLQSLSATRDAQKRLAEIIGQVDAIVWEADPQTGAMTYVSPQVREWLGCEPENWLGPLAEHFARWLHPEDRSAILSRFIELTTHGQDYAFEFQLVRNPAPLTPISPGTPQADASAGAPNTRAMGQVAGQHEVFQAASRALVEGAIWVRNIVSVESRDGVPVRVYGLMLDVTERKRAGALIQENEQRFRAIFEGALDAIFILDSGGHFQRANEAAGDLLGVPALELKGRALSEFVPGRYSAAFGRGWREYLTRATARGELLVQRADGETRDLEFSWRADFVPGRHLAVARDISLRKASRARLMLLERAIESVSSGVLMLDARSSDSSIFYVNEAWERITGHAQAEAIGEPFPGWSSFEPSPELDRLEHALAEQRECRVSLRQSRPDERAIWIELALSPVRDDEGVVTHFIAVKTDISQRREAEESQRESNAILQATQEAAADGIFLIDEAGAVVSCNSRFTQMWQIPGPLLEELRVHGQLMYYILSLMADPDEFLERISFLIDHSRASTRDEVRLKDGRVFERYSAPAIAPGGKNYGRVWSFSDITERKSTEQQLRHQAFHDALTELPNRAFFMDTLTRVLARARRSGEIVAVLFLDLDRFKVINDSLGHETGDQLLIEASRRLKNSLRPGDLAARFGGDEFTILLEGIEQVADATTVAERIAESLSTPFDLGGHEVYTTTSVGIVLSNPGGDRAEDLLRDADVAMYRAKSKGRARYEIFDSEMSAAAFERLRMEIDLRQGIKRGQLRLHYQPLVDLRTGRIVGAEALVRWQHVDRGLILPGDFIEMAEESGMIFPLGTWVLREACAQARAWTRKYLPDEPFHVSVNISAKQFHGPSLSDEIARALTESGLDPARLNLEITESVMLSNGSGSGVDIVAEGLESLRALGVRLSLDDFGTGFSSLSYLKQFPLDTLKIDRSFVSQGQNNPEEAEQNAAIVRAVQGLGRALKMTVVAEGIETREQLERLRALGCDLGQGYFFARPLTATAFEELLRQAPEW